MNMRSIVAAIAFLVLPAGATWAQIASDEQEFQAMAATLKANDAERQSAIDTCISLGLGANPAGLAEFMGVAVENAAKAWCLRMTNGIVDGKLTLADMQSLSSGNFSANAATVLKTPTHGE